MTIQNLQQAIADVMNTESPALLGELEQSGETLAQREHKYESLRAQVQALEEALEVMTDELYLKELENYEAFKRGVRKESGAIKAGNDRDRQREFNVFLAGEREAHPNGMYAKHAAALTKTREDLRLVTGELAASRTRHAVLLRKMENLNARLQTLGVTLQVQAVMEVGIAAFTTVYNNSQKPTNVA